jgi:glutamine synthetase
VRFGTIGRACNGIIGPELSFHRRAGRQGRLSVTPTNPENVYVVGRKGDPAGMLLTMLRSLRDVGLRVTAANHEFCPGPFEINLDHSELLDAADRAFRLKSAVQEIARLHGRMATCMAKPFNDEGGSGFHLHMSLVNGDGTNVFGAPYGAHGLSDQGLAAIAGVLAHAPALAALLNPDGESLQAPALTRFAPWLIDWGLDNRSTMVRIPPERGGSTRMEVRLGDATANPYLAMAGLGAAVYLGIRNGLKPAAPVEGYGYNPENAPMLPHRLTDALNALEADTELCEVLGTTFVESFVAYKRNEVERFERHVTDWELREYAYHL